MSIKSLQLKIAARCWQLCLAVTMISCLSLPQRVDAAPQEAAAPEVTQEGATAEAKAEAFVRIRRDERNRPLAMQTAIQRYSKLDANGTPILVDLIGVVHIGEIDYYQLLNERFKGYDALLYELVAPEGTRVNPGEGRGGPVSGLQNGMKDMLGLEFQLDHIDYLQDNFVHADMSPEEFVESMTQNDESFLKMFFKAMGSSMAMQGSQGGGDNGAVLAAMFSSDREMNMRKQMAGQLSNMDASMVAFSGTNGSTIIHHRNGKAFEVLSREIEAGKRTLGVFYGAGHLDDMEDRLLAMGFEPSAPREWLIAWKLTRNQEAIDAAVVADLAAANSADDAATETSEPASETNSIEVESSETPTEPRYVPEPRMRRFAPLGRFRRR